MRILLLSWEYPPVVEGGLARAVRKLSEQLVREGAEVHVLTRGGGRLPAVEDRHGVMVHRVREPTYPKGDVEAFIRWVDHMNADMLERGMELSKSLDFDLVQRTQQDHPMARDRLDSLGSRTRVVLTS